MPALVQGGHQAILGDIGYDTADRLLARGVTNSKVLSKVIEEVSKKTKSICNDNVYSILVAEVRDRELILQRRVGEDDHLEPLQLGKIRSQAVGFEDSDGHIRVQLCDPRSRHICAALAHILWLEEELRREIGDGNGSRVKQSERLDASEGNVFG